MKEHAVERGRRLKEKRKSVSLKKKERKTEGQTSEALCNIHENFRVGWNCWKGSNI